MWPYDRYRFNFFMSHVIAPSLRLITIVIVMWSLKRLHVLVFRLKRVEKYVPSPSFALKILVVDSFRIGKSNSSANERITIARNRHERWIVWEVLFPWNALHSHLDISV